MLFFITGTSRGIGHALAQKALELNHKVVGISRTQTITHDNYTHITLDLSSVSQVENFKFSPQESTEDIVLINNAGSLGEMAYVGMLEPKPITKTLNLNVISPFLLMNAFIRTFSNQKGHKFIINISSGAGKNPYDGWSSYCASKAALDMLTRVAHKEHQIRNNTNFTFYACSPGVVETQMQKEIRQSDSSSFQLKPKFIDLFENKINKSPAQAAEQILSLLDQKNPKDIFVDFWQG